MFAFAALVVALAGDAGSPGLPACVHYRPESRYVPYGYNHVVVIENGCSKPVTCAVATDVVPQAQSVDVPAGKTAEVTTFMGSPQQSFVPKVSCQLR